MSIHATRIGALQMIIVLIIVIRIVAVRIVVVRIVVAVFPDSLDP